MSLSGLFITMGDRNSLRMCMDNGVYGSRMAGKLGETHYKTLADYACAREGTHVFFFIEKHIVYGGIVQGSPEYGSFVLNGTTGVFRDCVDATLVWDESARYEKTKEPGVFITQWEKKDGEMVPVKKCQPYLLRFTDGHEDIRTGTMMDVDSLYFELCKHHHLFPSNTISKRSFCPITPHETRILLEYLCKSDEHFSHTYEGASIQIQGNEEYYVPEYGRRIIRGRKGKLPEYLIEALLCGDTNLLPAAFRPKHSVAICRQVPMPPTKPPVWMYRGDVCIYEKEAIGHGSLPNVVIEIKKKETTQDDVQQVEKYVRLLRRLVEINPGIYGDVDNIRFLLVAPEIGGDSSVSTEFAEQIQLVQLPFREILHN